MKDLSKGLEDNISSLSHACGAFKERVQEVVSAHKRNRKTLQCHLQLLELLEIPQLVESCARNGFVDEAIELAAFVNGLERRHLLAVEVKGSSSGSEGVIQSIVGDVQRSLITLRESLLSQLADTAALPKQIAIVAALRKLDSLLAERHLSGAHNNRNHFLHRLEIKRLLDYLEARTLWMHKQRATSVAGIAGAYGKAVELIEGKRIALHAILTHTLALFQPSPTANQTQESGVVFTIILRAWATQQVSLFTNELKGLLLSVEDGAALRALLEQSLFLAARLAHPTLGLDITAILLPLFESVLLQKVSTELHLAESQLATAIAFEKVTMPHHVTSDHGAGLEGVQQQQVLVVPLFNTTTDIILNTASTLDQTLSEHVTNTHNNSEEDLRAPTQLLRLPPLCLAMNTILGVLSFVRGCPLGPAYTACRAMIVQMLGKMVVHVAEQAQGIRTRGAKFLGDGFMSNTTTTTNSNHANNNTRNSRGSKQSAASTAAAVPEEKADVLYATVLANDFLPHVLLALDAAFGRPTGEQLRYYESQLRASDKSNAHVVMNRKQAEAILGRDLAVEVLKLWKPLQDNGLLSTATEEAAAVATTKQQQQLPAVQQVKQAQAASSVTSSNSAAAVVVEESTEPPIVQADEANEIVKKED